MQPLDNNERQVPGHRQLGLELDLFHFSEIAPGMAFWHGRGMAIWNALSAFWREQNDVMGYEEVRSPIVCDAALWKQSGHWDKYRDDMFHFELDGHAYGLKAMNCPCHVDIYKLRPRSYRELPVRLSEQGLVHRYEKSGAVNGLLRARAFSIDDAHLFCREEQIQQEVSASLDLAQRIYQLFGLELRVELSLRPENRLGSDERWDKAEDALRQALLSRGVPFEEVPGGGAFYGPKIDLFMRDSLGRDWQLGSVQLDYQMPERFDLRYIAEDGRDQDADGEAYRPVLVHRAMFGSFERFVAILLEHFGGKLPLWCSPRPVVVIPRSADEDGYADDVIAQLRCAGVRAEKDVREESIGKRIREAEVAHVPVMLVVGPREVAAGSVAVRRRGEREIVERPLSAVCDWLEAAVRERSLILPAV